jgi:hypothetical protein
VLTAIKIKELQPTTTALQVKSATLNSSLILLKADTTALHLNKAVNLNKVVTLNKAVTIRSNSPCTINSILNNKAISETLGVGWEVVLRRDYAQDYVPAYVCLIYAYSAKEGSSLVRSG